MISNPVVGAEGEREGVRAVEQAVEHAVGVSAKEVGEGGKGCAWQQMCVLASLDAYFN